MLRFLPGIALLPLLCACASTPRGFVDRALGASATFAAAKATALEACAKPDHFIDAQGPFLVRSCRGQDQIMEQDPFVGKMYSFAPKGGPRTTVCVYDDIPPDSCTGEHFDEIMVECKWETLCSLPERKAR